MKTFRKYFDLIISAKTEEERHRLFSEADHIAYQKDGSIKCEDLERLANLVNKLDGIF